MFIPFNAGRAWRRQKPRSSAGSQAVVLKQSHILARVTLLTACCLWILILAVIALARVRPIASIELPTQLQPRGPLPQTAHCLLSQGRYDDCQFDLNSQAFDLTYDSKSRTIIRILVRGQQYTISDLLLAWGTPTGFTRFGYGCSIVIMWNTRAAHLNTCALQMSSRIDLLEYALAQVPDSPWRGFTCWTQGRIDGETRFGAPVERSPPKS